MGLRKKSKLCVFLKAPRRPFVLRQSLLWFIYMHVIIAGEVTGFRLVTTNNFTGFWLGDVCMDPPPVKPTCGWIIHLTSNVSLSVVKTYTYGDTVMQSQQEFYISSLNKMYRDEMPTTSSEFCIATRIQGSFGNILPSFIEVTWYCICSNTTTTDSGFFSSSSCSLPTSSTTVATSNTIDQPATSGNAAECFFTKHAGKCYISSLEKSDLTTKLLCFHACLTNASCRGVNIEVGSYTHGCTFVTDYAIDTSQLLNSDICEFWEKE